MKIQSTSDISIELLNRNSSVLPAEWSVEVDEAQFFAKAITVPTWVALIADAVWWKKALGFAASQFLAGYLKEAGKAAWNNQGKLIPVAKAVPSHLRDLANFVLSIKADSPRTFVAMEIEITEFHSFRLRLDYVDLVDLEFAIAVVVGHLPALEELVLRENLAKGRIVGSGNLELASDHSLRVKWMDHPSLDKREVVLPFGD